MRRTQGAAWWCRGGGRGGGGGGGAPRAGGGPPPRQSPMVILVVAEEEWGTQLGCVVGAIAFGVVQGGDVDSARAGGRRGEGRGGVAAVLHADHASGDAVANQIECDICVGDGDDLVDGVGFATAQVVS